MRAWGAGGEEQHFFNNSFCFNWADMWGHVHLTKRNFIFATSALTSGSRMSDWLQICDLFELQLACSKVVDFGCQNVKWYQTVNFA
jgi:hypothetical protein